MKDTKLTSVKNLSTERFVNFCKVIFVLTVFSLNRSYNDSNILTDVSFVFFIINLHRIYIYKYIDI